MDKVDGMNFNLREKVWVERFGKIGTIIGLIKKSAYNLYP